MRTAECKLPGRLGSAMIFHQLVDVWDLSWNRQLGVHSHPLPLHLRAGHFPMSR